MQEAGTSAATGAAVASGDNVSAAKPVAAPVAAQQTSAVPQQREENESKGPCGLPFKCSVS